MDWGAGLVFSLSGTVSATAGSRIARISVQLIRESGTRM
jgi:hypothetical protein